MTNTGGMTDGAATVTAVMMPQWSPVINTGRPSEVPGQTILNVWPQWRPVLNTGGTPSGSRRRVRDERRNGAR